MLKTENIFILVGNLNGFVSLRFETAGSLVWGPDKKLSYMQCQEWTFSVGYEVAIKVFKC